MLNDGDNFWFWFVSKIDQRVVGEKVLGIDIGGANLKFAFVDLNGFSGLNEFRSPQLASTREVPIASASVPFSLWKHPERLGEALRIATQNFRPDRIAITMTGEIADCYATKAAGVASIAEQAKIGLSAKNVPLEFYSQAGMEDRTNDERAKDRDGNGGIRPATEVLTKSFLTGDQAIANPTLVSASNWHALASLMAQWQMENNRGSHSSQGTGVVLDLGSTTLDITPIFPQSLAVSQVVPAQTDWQRIRASHLVYSGVGRSPLACVLPQVFFDGHWIPLAQELFATMSDVYLLTGDVREDAGNLNTADQRPCTKAAARQRIARMFCSDTDELPPALFQAIAEQAKANHLSSLRVPIFSAFPAAPTPDNSDRREDVPWAVICGQGEFLLRHLLAGFGLPLRLLSLRELWGETLSGVAPAVAVALLNVIREDRRRQGTGPK